MKEDTENKEQPQPVAEPKPEPTTEPKPEPEPQEQPEAKPQEQPETEPEPEKPEPVPPQPRGESFWTPKELAAKLNCSQPWIYRMIKEDKIKAIPQGRYIKINPEEVQRLMEHGLPLPPKPKPEIRAEEEIIVEGKHAERVKPPTEKKKEEEGEKEVPWPISILFKPKKKEE